MNFISKTYYGTYTYTMNAERFTCTSDEPVNIISLVKSYFSLAFLLQLGMMLLMAWIVSVLDGELAFSEFSIPMGITAFFIHGYLWYCSRRQVDVEWSKVRSVLLNDKTVSILSRRWGIASDMRYIELPKDKDERAQVIADIESFVPSVILRRK